MLVRVKLFHEFDSDAEFIDKFAVPEAYLAAFNGQVDLLLDAWQAALTRLLKTTLELAASNLLTSLENEVDVIELNVNLGAASTIQTLNKEFRHKDYVTDVLSFPQLDLHEGKATREWQESDFAECFDDVPMALSDVADDEEIFCLNLGDIYLCGDKVAEQAENYGHSYWREFNFLCCHGFLHVLGYDHEEGQREESLQFALQDQILSALQIERTLTEPKASELVALAKEFSEQDCLTLQTESEAKIDETVPDNFKSGFVAIVGRPNVGKSTLLNQISGAYLAITSQKAQTTRDNIRTIYNGNNSQIIFTDTPGAHKADDKLGTYMNQSGIAAIKDADLVLLVVDAHFKTAGLVEKKLIERLEELKKPAILVINKSDSIVKQELLPLMANYNELYPFIAIIPISALDNEGIKDLLNEIEQNLPNGPRYYPLDYFTDQTERSICAELIREQVLKYYHQELPYGVATEIEKFAEEYDEDGQRVLAKIQASIITEREGHKKMLIGKGGLALKRLASSARIKMEDLLDCKVYLEIRVKVRENWRDKEMFLNNFGYNLKQAQNRPLR